VSGEVVIDYLGRAVQDVLANTSAERGKDSLATHSSKSSFRSLNLSFLNTTKCCAVFCWNLQICDLRINHKNLRRTKYNEMSEAGTPSFHHAAGGPNNCALFTNCGINWTKGAIMQFI
jgi:hypothetical protein